MAFIVDASSEKLGFLLWYILTNCLDNYNKEMCPGIKDKYDKLKQSPQ